MVELAVLEDLGGLHYGAKTYQISGWHRITEKGRGVGGMYVQCERD